MEMKFGMRAKILISNFMLLSAKGLHFFLSFKQILADFRNKY